MSSPDLTDLLGRVALRDRNAFSALYGESSSKLFAICLRMLRDRGEAEDALQEVFVRIWHKADSFSAEGHSASAWLATVARYHCIDRLRRRKQAAAPLEAAGEVADPGHSPEQQAELASEGARIDRCMEELEGGRAQAVRSAYVEGASYQELAERFDVPLNTMRTWLRRSLMKLRECMER
ncbi:sigma-70 family RNA polymerase sigma factor [Rhizobium halophytocola]|uniref:RNA polymerase sigma-70 factor (ECF subfamily) n=1 Tax=Rhizobium halophytocola TaxID=735519 RepID=A0ABS4E074_9HYPH|nr:sigma-70 family RNA polymerase sigma factor [Rhizobium halophytocola]MBP1851332.1 RNA polymerase sigma-70 factor (ECF subfamily) [Rhizobium halophytocola]